MVGPPAGGRAERRRAERKSQRDPIGIALRGFGELFVTVGLIVLLFVAYELWVTNMIGEQKQAQATEALDELWSDNPDIVTDPNEPVVVTESGGEVVTTVVADPDGDDERTRVYDTTEGVGFAKMYIPAFGPDFMFTIVEGTQQKDLYAGPGHYLKTQYPGELGNFALAGHRVNKGAPFDDLGLLESCDAIVIETHYDWFVYRVLPMQDEVADWDPTAHPQCAGVEAPSGMYDGVYGREITHPSDGPQIYAVPHQGGYQVPDGAKALITLTTCHPKFSDRERMIIHGELVASYPKADGFLPDELQEGS